jgi:hypothetical protein
MRKCRKIRRKVQSISINAGLSDYALRANPTYAAGIGRRSD